MICDDLPGFTRVHWGYLALLLYIEDTDGSRRVMMRGSMRTGDG